MSARFRRLNTRTPTEWSARAPRQGCSPVGESGRFFYFPGCDATGANSHSLHPARRLDSADFFQVRVPPAPRRVVGVAYVIAEHRLFAADLTDLSHWISRFSSYLLCAKNGNDSMTLQIGKTLIFPPRWILKYGENNEANDAS